MLANFVWSDLGGPPEVDEVEVTVIGPGHGESVLVHLGQGEWLVVDSCADHSETPVRAAPLRYLEAIGVDASSAVKLIVASHWDDDHVRGIADLIAASASAVFSCSTAFSKTEFVEFVETVASSGAATGQGNVSEFRRVLQHLADSGTTLRRATPGRHLLNSKSAKVRSWSPNDLEDQKFLTYVAQNFPKPWEFAKRAVAPKRNHASVVLTVEVGDTAILLGADMEAASNDDAGWGAVVSEGLRGEIKKSQVVKIPHHGSAGSHDPRMWNDLLDPMPLSVVAPFGRGKIASRPPKSSDIRRISGLSSAVFLTSPHKLGTVVRKELAVERTLREQGVVLMPLKNQLGIVRLRKQPSSIWKYEMFGPARSPKQPPSS